MKLIRLLALSFLMVGCDSDADMAPSGFLVIEGGIDSNGYISVMLTSSVEVSDESGCLDDMMIRWGKVTVDDGTRQVILTGRVNSALMPPYEYYSFDMLGVPGHTYTLTAEYDGKTVVSSCYMHEPTPIASMESNPSGEGYVVYVKFVAPDDCPAYYHVRTMCIEDEDRLYPGMLGTVVATTPGEIVTVPAYRGKHFSNSKDFSPLWEKGQSVMVSLDRVSKEVYDFWCDYNDKVLFGGSQFVGLSTNLPTNVSGGRGVWSARGVSQGVILVE